MKKNIVNIHQLAWQTDDNGDFSYLEKPLSNLTVAEKLGATLYQLMPGKKAFPYHYHYGNEEAVFILTGCGTLRLNNEMLAIKEGDYISFPVGATHAHQVINTSQTSLIFLCFSTMIHPEVVEYPDSNKIGVSGGAAPGKEIQQFALKAYLRKKDKVDYFDGE